MSDCYNIDGLNYSKYVRIEKSKTGLKRFNKLKERFNISKYRNVNNIIIFNYNGDEYHYGLISYKIRKKGSKWTSSVIATLTGKKINKVKKKTFGDKKAPGKHKDKTWREVMDTDIQYIYWMIKNTNDSDLKNNLIELINNK